MAPERDLAELLDGRQHSVVKIELTHFDSGEYYMIEVLRHLPGAGIKARQANDIRACTHQHARCPTVTARCPTVTHFALARFAGEFDPLPGCDEFVQAFDDHPTGQGFSVVMQGFGVVCGTWEFCQGEQRRFAHLVCGT